MATCLTKINTIKISTLGDESLILEVVNYAKNYVLAANSGYELLINQRAAAEEKRLRLNLEKQVAEAQKRKNILSNVKI